MTFKFELFRLYYKYADPSAINHYNVVNKLLQFKQFGSAYCRKYPEAQPFVNLNDNLFTRVPQAKTEYLAVSNTQKQLKQSILDDIDVLCKAMCTANANANSKDQCCDICLPAFQHFYIDKSYHMEQFTDDMIQYIKSDRCLK